MISRSDNEVEAEQGMARRNTMVRQRDALRRKETGCSGGILCVRDAHQRYITLTVR